jgi:hypothetical protein
VCQGHFPALSLQREWETRFTVRPARSSDVHRRIERTQPLEQILSMRRNGVWLPTTPVRWNGHRLWPAPRSGLWFARSSRRDRDGRGIAASECRRAVALSPPRDYPGRKPWKRIFPNGQDRTFLLCVDEPFPSPVVGRGECRLSWGQEAQRKRIGLGARDRERLKVQQLEEGHFRQTDVVLADGGSACEAGARLTVWAMRSWPT